MQLWQKIGIGWVGFSVLVGIPVLVHVTGSAGRTSGCDRGDMLDCANLAMLTEAGHGVPQDTRKALALYDKACTGGIAWACGTLGQHYAQGLSVPVDLPKALPLLNRGCDGVVTTGCYALAVLLRDGRGTAVDLPRAEDLFKRACTASTPHGRNVHASGREPGCQEAKQVAAQIAAGGK